MKSKSRDTVTEVLHKHANSRPHKIKVKTKTMDAIEFNDKNATQASGETTGSSEYTTWMMEKYSKEKDNRIKELEAEAGNWEHAYTLSQVRVRELEEMIGD